MKNSNLKGWMGILLYLLLIGAASGQSVDFQSGTFSQALEQARQSHKPLFLDVYTEWCQPCKWMEKHVFTDSEVGKYMNENYLSFRVNAETQETALIKQLGVDAYPTMIFYGPNGVIAHRQIGALDAASFLSMTQDLINMRSYQEAYAKKNNSSETVHNLAMAMRWQDPKKAKQLATGYLLDLDDKKYADSLNWILLRTFVASTDHLLFSKIISSESLKKNEPEDFRSYLNSSVEGLLKVSIEKPSSTFLKKYIGYLSQNPSYFSNVDSLLLVGRLRYAQRNDDKAFVSLMIQYISTYQSGHPIQQAEIALQLAEQHFKTEILEFASTLANQSFDKLPSSTAQLAKALVFDKLNDPKSAYAHLLLAFPYANDEMKQTLDLHEEKLRAKLEYHLKEGVNTIIETKGTDDGRFTLGAGTRRLMYGYPIPKSTSHFMVNINGKLASNAGHFPANEVTRLLGETKFSGEGNTPVVSIAFLFEGVLIRQVLTPVDQAGKEIKGGLAQYYRVSYEFENTDNQFKVIGLNVLFDTMIDDNDYCMISADGRPLKNEILMTTSYMPRQLLFYRTERDTSDHMGAAIIQGLQATKPDKMMIGNWPLLYRVRWALKSNNLPYGDSAYLLQWENRRLPPNGKLAFITYYGLPQHKKPKLQILLEDNSQRSLVTSIYFAHERSDLDLNAKMKIGDLLNDTTIQITGVLLNGYADITGGRDYNFALSQRRIETVGAILKAHGIVYIPKPYGIDQSDNNDYNQIYGNAWDRRVEITMYYRKKTTQVLDRVSGL